MIIRCLCTLLRSNVCQNQGVRGLHWKKREASITSRAQLFRHLHTCSKSVQIVSRTKPKSEIVSVFLRMMSRYVVYDCDTGNDDAWGLLMLIKAEEAYRKIAADTPAKFEILGITCVQGNTDVDSVAKNTLRVLGAVDRTDIPVYRGCANPILSRTWENPENFHGRDGFGDVEHSEPVDMSLVRPEHAVNKMYELACKYPKRVDFLLVGPLTNFAMCINMYGASFMDNVGGIYIMGGNYRGKGNITKSAEFNFMMDPEAANIVLASVRQPVVILPWETCIDADFDITLEWRFQVLGAVQSKAMDLLNRVEKAIFLPKKEVNWVVCDAALVAAYICPHLAIKTTRLYHVTVELTGTHTRGQMVLDHLRAEQDNASIIMEIEGVQYRKMLSWTGGLEGVHIEPELGGHAGK